MLNTKKIEADLHCHTTCSDGTFSPEDVVGMAARLGLKALGITDHDTIEGWAEADRAGREWGVEIVHGLELNTDWQGIEVHILGYELDGSSPVLREKLDQLRRARHDRIGEIIIALARLGIKIELEQVEAVVRGESVGRVHIAQVLMAGGYVESVGEAFERYLAAGAPAYVPRHKLTPREGIELIRQAHGVSVLAHPGIHPVDQAIGEWVDDGLQGIEVIHSRHTLSDQQHYERIAREYNLLATGGSDFHGEKTKPEAVLGNFGVDMETVRKIRPLAQFVQD